MSTNTFTQTERIHIAALTDSVLMAEVVIRSIGDAASARSKYLEGKQHGCTFALELVSGIPSDVIRETLEAVTQAELHAYVRGDADIRLV